MKLEEMKGLAEEFVRSGDYRNVDEVQKFLKAHGYELSNLYQELEMSSRLVDTHRDVSEVGGVVQLHSHVFYEMIYCCSDSAMQYLIGSERYRLEKGDVILIAPGVPHRPFWTAESQQPYQREVIWISQEFMEGCKRHLMGNVPKAGGEHILLHTAGTEWEKIASYFHAGVLEAEAKELGWQAFVCANAMKILTLIARALEKDSEAQGKAERPELLDKVMNYIERNLSERITLEGTAKHFLVSASTISQIFNKQMGVSFYRVVTQRRLIAAKNKINIGIPMEEVAEQVGFCDYSTFYRAFKQEYGISPRQYKTLGEQE